MADDKKNPKEASNIFHSIMKASVAPMKYNEVSKEHLDSFISAVKEKFGIEITLDNGVVYPKGTNENTIAEIQNFYKVYKSIRPTTQ